MLSNTYVTRERFLEERGRQTYHSPQTTDQNELRNEMKMTLEEKRETRPKRNSAQYEAKTRQKLSFDKETQTERDFLNVFKPKYTERLLSRSPVSPNLSGKSTDLPMFLKNRRQEKKDLVCKRYPQRLESKFQHESLIPSHRRFSFMESYSPRVEEEVYYSAEESLKSPEMTYELECMSSSDIPTGKRILFLGSDLDLMRAILYHQYKNSALWRMSEKKELQLVECKNEGIYFYCGCFSGSHPVSDVRRLMMNSEKYTSHGFHGCVLFIRTALDKNILHIFDAKFLRQFCILLISTDLDFIGFDDKNIVRFDWFSFGPEILKNKLKLVSTEQFLFDKLIMKMAFDIMPPEPKALKEMNELKEKCLSLRDFIHTIIYKYKVGHEVLPLTQEIRLLLQECLDILEDHNKLTKK
ncbi:uncharacterized protein LOC106069861 [Biomphalaria glabrata]|uniref:Uncharacterized protein LOC106069861 n=1 Tax=Biomphalaria glabrata TaxID=6526 RepID=A0A9W2Z6E8_BIOGL|nr:uncharacterized protein LOC106069861 [Biomphalaria glabrata]XP_055870502.1 uncharacterized protein LOC106069861 [Biomphalaria glabrata]